MAARAEWRKPVRMAAALLRVWLGWQWFQAGYEKVGSDAWTGAHAGAAVAGFLKGALAKAGGEHPDVQPFYAAFVERVALPHAHVFSYLVAYGELLVGVGLLLGALTTVALLGGALMNLNYLLAGTVSVNPIWLSAAFILLFVGNTGLLGADGLWTWIRTTWRPDPGGYGRRATGAARVGGEKTASVPPGGKAAGLPRVAHALRAAARALLGILAAAVILVAAGCGRPAATTPGAGYGTQEVGTEAGMAGGMAGMAGMASESSVPPQADPVPAEAPAVSEKPSAGGHNTVRVTIPVEPRTLQVAPDLTTLVWAYDGRVPGPVIRARQGDTVEVTLENRDSIAHSIDFHAARVAPNRAFVNVQPGESKTISFVVNDPGVFVYHCATEPMVMHIAMGMYGMLIVDPAEDRAPAREFTIVQSEFYANMNMDAMRLGDASAVVFNGVANQYAEAPLRARVGETVRIYFVNAGPDHFSAFHVVGTIFDRVEADGNPANEERGVSTYTVAPGGAAVFEMHFDEPGRYPFVTHSMGDMMAGAKGIIEVTK